MSAAFDNVLGAKAAGRKITALTAYDYPMARLLDESGVDIILVGDSLGMVVLGYPDTTSVTMEHMLHHCAAAARGVQRALVVCDLPYGSYDRPEQAVRNARRLVDAGAHAVKLEGGVTQTAQISAIVAEAIPVMAHIGMLPQRVKLEGGYRMKGVTPHDAALLLEDGRSVERSGAFAVVLELVEPGAALAISQQLEIPTIGIGSGTQCDGQVLVTHDLIGLFPWFKPKFVQRHAAVAEAIRGAVAVFIEQTTGSKGASE